MKWNCGPTALERHRARQEWHPWFTWRPVQLSFAPYDYCWLEMVERRYIYICVGYGERQYQYRSQQGE